MIVQDDLRGDALRLEIAIALLPLVGRVQHVDGNDRVLGNRGNRLTRQEDRRLVIDDAARGWEALSPLRQREHGVDLRVALYAYACDYVGAVEAGRSRSGRGGRAHVRERDGSAVAQTHRRAPRGEHVERCDTSGW